MTTEQEPRTTREEARRAGLVRYTGGPRCLRGHVGERYVSTNACVECLPIRVPREYSSWVNARLRCTDPENESWHLYGGRGIKMCEGWIESFQNFLIDMGPRPDNTWLERVDNNKLDGYFPGNVVWATSHRQARNRRSNVMIDAGHGRRVCLTDAARGIGVNYSTIRSRSGRFNETAQQAFDYYRVHGVCPRGLHRSHRIALDGVILSLAEVGRRLGYNPRTIREIALKQHGGDLQAVVDTIATLQQLQAAAA